MTYNVRAVIIPGYPWEGADWNLPTTTPERAGLGGAQLRATAEAARHPGLYQSRSDDVVSPQMAIRPALIIPPDELGRWNAILQTDIRPGGQ